MWRCGRRSKKAPDPPPEALKQEASPPPFKNHHLAGSNAKPNEKWQANNSAIPLRHMSCTIWLGNGTISPTIPHRCPIGTPSPARSLAHRVANPIVLQSHLPVCNTRYVLQTRLTISPCLIRGMRDRAKPLNTQFAVTHSTLSYSRAQCTPSAAAASRFTLAL